MAVDLGPKLVQAQDTETESKTWIIYTLKRWKSTLAPLKKLKMSFKRLVVKFIDFVQTIRNMKEIILFESSLVTTLLWDQRREESFKEEQINIQDLVEIKRHSIPYQKKVYPSCESRSRPLFERAEANVWSF